MLLFICSMPRNGNEVHVMEAMKVAAVLAGCPTPVGAMRYPDEHGNIEITVRCREEPS